MILQKYDELVLTFPPEIAHHDVPGPSVVVRPLDHHHPLTLAEREPH